MHLTGIQTKFRIGECQIRLSRLIFSELYYIS
jgi:hypothetical protein